MKTQLLTIVFLFTTIIAASQKLGTKSYAFEDEPTTAISTGILMGGGGLVGVDVEHKTSSAIGFQAGLGYSSFGMGMNFHLQNKINSSFASIQYWRQGLGDNFFASYLGPMFVYRAPKYFQAGLGIGYILDKGSITDTKYRDQNFFLTYNVGVYFPL